MIELADMLDLERELSRRQFVRRVFAMGAGFAASGALLRAVSAARRGPLPELITLRDGDWHNPATWAKGRVPKHGDTVVIAHALTLTEDVIGVGVSVKSGASVAFGRHHV